MSANPVEAGRKGGQSRSETKLAAARRNGFQKANEPMLPGMQPKVPAQSVKK
jgi:hypothetical protein